MINIENISISFGNLTLFRGLDLQVHYGESEQLHEVGNTAFSVNVNTVDVVMLKEALSKAIEEENYEQASRLRDEIKRREQEEENTIV